MVVASVERSDLGKAEVRAVENDVVNLRKGAGVRHDIEVGHFLRLEYVEAVNLAGLDLNSRLNLEYRVLLY